ncbi:hypothetical protein FHR90_001849 [Endobacter medicaginis]|uniref:Uncharacterized protein n=1 Tax=Endobacter medicaginis TaxID=1181271 RepID=A0A839UW14_9PROT|nr:hypothetical protein [Endobacter medicaginis]MBB3174017.1 hypothetical protein [Endobacter medicaginis]MCX5475126.1 hypothetical protein [Endobacter medicaginis]NVN31694.1 hypothetical protein [Endobacter medicaginis]
MIDIAADRIFRLGGVELPRSVAQGVAVDSHCGARRGIIRLELGAAR